MVPNKMKGITRYYFLLAFIEGACVMAIELAGAKMIAPFYGTTLYVWAAVLAVTLGGLTTGYFLGGWATYRFSGQKLLFGILLLGTLFIALMPVLALKIIPATSGMGIRMGALFSALSFMFLPLICMGMVSPTLIQLNNTELKGTGKIAGTIYAVSTVGGIIMTLLMGFYFLPEWGIRKSIFLTAVLLGSMPLMLVVVYRKYKLWMGTGVSLLCILLLSSAKPFEDPNLPLKYLYRSEGILGQVSVVDNPKRDELNRIFRVLFINHIPQTKCNVQVIPASAWLYPHRLATLASIKPRGSKALLIGMGGGTVAMELKKMGFKVDIVEIDDRMPNVAEVYFGFEPDSVTIIIDDGRHYLNNTREKYDLVLIDVLFGEAQPSHLFTLESFAELNRILLPDALVLINFQGYLIGEHGQAARSIY
jgi:MFS family permease